MKILQVITSLSTGGAEKIVVELSLALKALGHEVDVCVFSGGNTLFKNKLVDGGCKVIEFSKKNNVYSIKNLIHLKRLIHNYDIVHTHNTSPQLYAAIASLFTNVKLITTEHSTNNRRRKWSWYKFIDRWMYGRYDHVVCISEIAEKKLKEYISLDNVNISTINNGVDVQKFANAEPVPELLESDFFHVVMIAGFREAKDQDTLIKAISLLPSNFKLWLVGDGIRRPELEKKVTDLGVSTRVTLMGLRSDVPNILKSADVVVMSSHWEGLSLSNIEGMASGKPFVASDVNGLREVTKGYGILFPHEDAQALATVIQKLHDDRAYYQQVAESCYQRALQFDISKMVDGYLKVYNQLI